METLLTYLRTFRNFSDDEGAEIAAAFESKHFLEGDYLLRKGHVCNELFFVVDGVLRIVSTNDKGVDVTYFFIGKNQFCTILQNFNEGTSSFNDIQACCNTSVLSVKKAKLLALYQKLPFVKEIIDSANQQRMLEKIRLKNALSGHDAVNRYKVFLTEQSNVAFQVPVNHIASYLNVTPQSLSRIRRELI